MRFELRFRKALSWKSAQTAPISTSTRITVFLAAPVIRTVERMEQPSIRQLMICARVVESSRFMSSIILQRFSMSIAKIKCIIQLLWAKEIGNCYTLADRPQQSKRQQHKISCGFPLHDFWIYG